MSSSQDSKVNRETQTPDSLYQFEDSETQTGIATEILQDEITPKSEGTTLLDFYASRKQRPRAQWKQIIENGCVTVDMEVATDPAKVLSRHSIVEFVNVKRDAEVGCAN